MFSLGYFYQKNEENFFLEIKENMAKIDKNFTDD